MINKNQQNQHIIPRNAQKPWSYGDELVNLLERIDKIDENNKKINNLKEKELIFGECNKYCYELKAGKSTKSNFCEKNIHSKEVESGPGISQLDKNIYDNIILLKTHYEKLDQNKFHFEHSDSINQKLIEVESYILSNAFRQSYAADLINKLQKEKLKNLTQNFFHNHLKYKTLFMPGIPGKNGDINHYCVPDTWVYEHFTCLKRNVKILNGEQINLTWVFPLLPDFAIILMDEKLINFGHSNIGLSNLRNKFTFDNNFSRTSIGISNIYGPNRIILPPISNLKELKIFCSKLCGVSKENNKYYDKYRDYVPFHKSSIMIDLTNKLSQMVIDEPESFN